MSFKNLLRCTPKNEFHYGPPMTWRNYEIPLESYERTLYDAMLPYVNALIAAVAPAKISAPEFDYIGVRIGNPYLPLSVRLSHGATYDERDCTVQISVTPDGKKVTSAALYSASQPELPASIPTPAGFAAEYARLFAVRWKGVSRLRIMEENKGKWYYTSGNDDNRHKDEADFKKWLAYCAAQRALNGENSVLAKGTAIRWKNIKSGKTHNATFGGFNRKYNRLIGEWNDSFSLTADDGYRYSFLWCPLDTIEIEQPNTSPLPKPKGAAVQNGTRFTVGQRVRVTWTDGYIYSATIKSVGPGQACVRWLPKDGGGEDFVRYNQMSV